MHMLVKQAEEERDLANEKFEEEERRHQKACAELAEMQHKIKEVCIYHVICVSFCVCVYIFIYIYIHEDTRTCAQLTDVQ